MKLSKAAQDIASKSNALLKPDAPVQVASGGQSNGVSHPASKASRSFQLDASGKATSAQPESPPGSDADLQELLKDSPFLDFNSPMTPYEWFKFVVMVRPPALSWHINRILLHTEKVKGMPPYVRNFYVWLGSLCADADVPLQMLPDSAVHALCLRGPVARPAGHHRERAPRGLEEGVLALLPHLLVPRPLTHRLQYLAACDWWAAAHPCPLSALLERVCVDQMVSTLRTLHRSVTSAAVLEWSGPS